MAKHRILRLIMPSAGDMDIINQEGGKIDLEPLFYGNESMGPHLQAIEIDTATGAEVVLSRSKLRVRPDEDAGFKVEIKHAQ